MRLYIGKHVNMLIPKQFHLSIYYSVMIIAWNNYYIGTYKTVIKRMYIILYIITNWSSYLPK